MNYFLLKKKKYTCIFRFQQNPCLLHCHQHSWLLKITGLSAPYIMSKCGNLLFRNKKCRTVLFSPHLSCRVPPTPPSPDPIREKRTGLLPLLSPMFSLCYSASANPRSTSALFSHFGALCKAAKET